MDISRKTKIINSYAIYAYGLAVKVILSALIILLLGAMVWVVIKSIIMLRGNWDDTVQNISRMVIVNTLMVLALLEVFRTTLAYFSEGRVKVTYLIDTVLVVVLSEVMVFWFKDIEYKKIMMVIALVFTLIIARILAIRFSPSKIDIDGV